MEFKVGDVVRLNPQYYGENVDPVKGTITAETTEWGAHKIHWEDGDIGDVYLSQASKYLIRVHN